MEYSKNSVILNKSLIEKYPWLYPHYQWSGEKVEDYDYTWTELDALSEGWREAFGELLCEEIQEELEKFDYADEYSIAQIKSKFGEMRWYDNGCPDKCRVHEIIENYAAISGYICEACGELDVPSTDGWIMPVCKECIKKMNYTDPDAYWEQISKEQFPHTLPLTRRYRRWSSKKDKWEEFVIDLTPTVQKIRKRYAERHGD